MGKRKMRWVRADEASVTQQRACREPMVAGGGCFAVWAGCGYWCKLWKQVAALQHPRLLRVCCMGLKNALFSSCVVLHLSCTW